MKKILVTGANGQLGRALNELLGQKEDVEIYNTDIMKTENINKMDITNISEVMSIVRQVRPYAIINCAAYTAVDACETDLDNAYRINAIGPRNVAIAANDVGAKIMQISTDYIFSGDSTEPYVEFDQPGARSAYGKTKYEGEQFVREFCRQYFIVRTAWLYGDGKNFVKTMLKLAETHDEVTVVDDQTGSPTSTKVLAEIIDNLLWTDNYGVFHGTCEGSCSWAEFAEEIFRLAGKSTKVKHVTSEEYNAKAQRPANSVLDNYMLRLTTDYVADNWKKAIQEYIRNMK